MKIRRKLAPGRCCFCHDDLPPLATHRCPGCRATFHEDCRADLGRCTTIGCTSEARSVCGASDPDSRAVGRLESRLAFRTVFLATLVGSFLAGALLMVAARGTVVTCEDGSWTIFEGSGWGPSLLCVGMLGGGALLSGHFLRRNRAIDVRALLRHEGVPMFLTRRTESDSEGTTTVCELRDRATGRHVFDTSLLLFSPSLNPASEGRLTVRTDGEVALIEGSRGEVAIASVCRNR